MNKSIENSSPSVGLDLIWGVREIAKAICRPERATFYLLETGKILPARKIGGRWCRRAPGCESFSRIGWWARSSDQCVPKTETRPRWRVSSGGEVDDAIP